MTPREGLSSNLDRIAWQEAIFGDRLRRSQLLALRRTWELRHIDVNVYRNQPFELVGTALRPFLAFAGLEASVNYGAYDDSVSFSGRGSAGLEIVSLDFDRYRDRFTVAELTAWLVDRALTLRMLSPAPILVTSWIGDDEDSNTFNKNLPDALSGVPELYVCDVAMAATTLGADAFDDRSADLKASRWSDQLILKMARVFGLQWIPAAISSPIRAVIADLDGTLYDGVLGEDGPGGIVLSDDHLEVQRRLLELRSDGFFVGVVSRNQPEDVERLFRERRDFPLKRTDLSSCVANWESKAHNLAKVAEELRISTDAILFVDDNPGELATVSAAFPVHILHARSPQVTAAGLRMFPGIHRFSVTSTDAIRVDDLAAAQQRADQLHEAADPKEYLRSIGIELSFRVDNGDDVERMAQLSNKTNQFNTALSRKSQTEVAKRLHEGSLHAVTVGLRDRFSDSGTVCVLFAANSDGNLLVEEICISCRALGRDLETAMIMQAIQLLATKTTTSVTFSYAHGPRNEPALTWLGDVGGEVVDETGDMRIDWNIEKAREAIVSAPVTVLIEDVTVLIEDATVLIEEET
jgi:FkbH-like protein